MHVCCGDFLVDTQLLETCSSTSSSMSTIVRAPVHHGSDSNMSTVYCLHVSLDGTELVFLWWLVCNPDCAVMSAATLLASAACHGLSCPMLRSVVRGRRPEEIARCVVAWCARPWLWHAFVLRRTRKHGLVKVLYWTSFTSCWFEFTVRCQST